MDQLFSDTMNDKLCEITAPNTQECFDHSSSESKNRFWKIIQSTEIWTYALVIQKINKLIHVLEIIGIEPNKNYNYKKRYHKEPNNSM